MAKLLLEARDVSKAYGLRPVLASLDFDLYDGERVGLVGENGAGKSTFLHILAGDLLPDDGLITRRAPVSLISQFGDAAEASLDPALGSEFAAPPAREGLSGGEKTRRRIAGALSGKSQVLLADEPTTDLDAAGIQRLEKHLRSYPGALVLISHDRALLDGVCTRIVELEDGKLTSFPGNYSAYRQEKQRRRSFQQFKYEQYRAEEKRIRTMIQRETELASQKTGMPKRMGNSEARLHKREDTVVQGKIHQVRKMFESRLGRLEEVERPREDPAIAMRLGAATPVTSRTALEIRGISLRAGSRFLLENASMRLPTGTRTALLGENGCGKTTLMHRITAFRQNPAVRVSPGVKIGWFDQDHAATLNPEATALENALAESVVPESTVRTILARLNLRGDDVFKPLKVLSGGEKAKVALASLFARDINLLILDEPTNHLDVYTLEALTEVLKSYAGTVLVASHDRTFVSETANRLVFFENKSLTTFEGSWPEWEKAQHRDRTLEDMQLEITRLQMRLAVLTSRMSAPKKGDSPEKLNAEYQQVLAQLNALRT
ncbi:MAG: ABC-F family ATP-binding cassette domain-containing protein [Eubacteriales bacterium]|nr:ABC-F family ATP-binding cassette domain-containing protein [Eubacteriales bacterium]